MNIKGQQTELVTQRLRSGDPVAALKAALQSGASKIGAATSVVQDPHSWSEYVNSQAKLLKELVTKGLAT